MPIYDLNGNSSSSAYDILGANLSYAYELDGTPIQLNGDYDHWDTEYQHSILIARDEWAEEYRADSTVLPIVLHTDQHGGLSNNNRKALFAYLALAVKWDECSALINLGDVANYGISAFQSMVSCLAPIPIEKQINIWGNHEIWGGSVQMSNGHVASEEEFRDVLSFYYDNSAYNGDVRYDIYGTETMVDSDRHIRYIVFGGWNYDNNLGGISHYVMDGDTIDYIISMLSIVDNNDVVILSHIQPYTYLNNGQKQYDGTTTWFIPPTDGRAEITTGTFTLQAVVSEYDTSISQMLYDRKNKQSGTVKDSYGVLHSYDFTHCTSDLICSLHGHEHNDRYNYQPVGEYTMPVILFDALYYDNHPFYFVNINRTDGVVNCWKVDDQANIYRYSIPLEYDSGS